MDKNPSQILLVVIYNLQSISDIFGRKYHIRYKYCGSKCRFPHDSTSTTWSKSYATIPHRGMMALTKSLASARSRDIVFTALVSLFQIHTQNAIFTQTLALTDTPNHILTLNRFQTLTRLRNEAFSLKSSFSPITPKGCILPYVMGVIWNQRRKVR